MAHIHTKDEIWLWGGTPENAIQEMLKTERKPKRKEQIKISKLRSAFLELDSKLKEFGRTRCKFHKNRKSKRIGLECNHPAMGWGGMDRNTDCELANCPRVLCGDEGN